MIRKLTFTLLIIIGSVIKFGVCAQEPQPLPVPAEQKTELIDSITSDYYDWEKISLSGKLSSPMLPVTASVKVYMEKGRLIVISISAMLVGEAARIEIDQEKALVVNKLSNKYTTIEMETIEPVCPGGIEALQNMIMGRITVLGSGVLAQADSDKVEIYDVNEDTWMLLPNQDIENAPFVYFYTLSKKTFLPERFAVLDQNGLGSGDCFYEWTPKNMTMELVSELKGKSLEATLKLNNPDSNPKPISRIELSSKYTATDFKGVLR